ncbi:MAG TPA: FlgD immunoglobulin-like domain containing protein, partial [bacterium]
QATTFTFVSSQDAEVTIKIYTVAGQLIQTLANRFARSGFNMIEWDGRDVAGDLPANGVYLYKLIARSAADTDASQKEIIGKLAIVR